MAGDEYLGIELSNRLQRINGALLVMRKVGGSKRGPTPLNVGWAVTSASPGTDTPMLRQEEAGVPAWALSAPLGSTPALNFAVRASHDSIPRKLGGWTGMSTTLGGSDE